MKWFKKKKMHTARKAPGNVRVVTFNAHYGKDTLKIAKAFAENEALSQSDIILLQEIEHHHKEFLPRAQALAFMLGMEAIYFPAWKVKNTHSHGLAILSRFPIIKNISIQIPYFNLVYRSRTRIAVCSTILIHKIPLHIYNIHLDNRINIQERILQLEAVTNHVNNHPNTFAILAGDLNTVPIFWLKRILPVFYSNQKKKLNEFLLSHHFSTPSLKGYTLGQGLIHFKLDAIYSRGLPIVNYGIEKSVHVSDHKPLWVDIKLPRIRG